MNSDRTHSTMNRPLLLAFVGLCTLAAGNTDASNPENPPPQAVIETRRQGFKKMGAAMKAIVDQLKSDAPDNARMAAAAQAIGSVAEAQRHWFPAGSGVEAGTETDALPHIWKDREKFDSIANRLISESKTLAVAMSGNDLAAIRAQVKVVGDVCSTCHRSFRAD
jgi:cytochrome c556